MRQLFGSVISTFVQWYVFFLFSQLSFVIFSIWVFVTGFIFRTLGGILFGYLGDKVSRKVSLIVINVLILVFSLFLFFYPSNINVIVYRAIQGLTLGGEWGGASTIVLEAYANSRYRGFILSFIQLTVPLAVILSSLSMFYVYITRDWRIFLLVIAFLSGISILLIREVNETKSKTEFPLISAIKYDGKNILKSIGIKVSESAVFYIFTSYIFSIGNVSFLVALATLIQIVTIPLFGYLTDVVGRKKVEYIGLLFLLGGSIIFPSTFGEIVLSISDSALYAPQSSIFTELFKKEYRYTASSFAYQVASAIGGIIPPLVLSIIKLPISLILAPFILVSFVSLLTVTETRGKRID